MEEKITGKVMSVYLTDSELRTLENMCEDFQINPYKVLKIALQLLCRVEAEKKESTESRQKQKSTDQQSATSVKEKPKKTEHKPDLLERLFMEEEEETEENE